MWSLGAVISFYCNDEHLFTDPDAVLDWEGGRGVSTLDRDEYGSRLRGIVASLLLPNPRARPTAEKVLKESLTGDRQQP